MAQENNQKDWNILGDEKDKPATSVKSVTPNDSTDLSTGNCRALYINTGGNLTLIAADDDDSSAVTLSVPDQCLLPVRTRRVKSTGTTASGIFALY